MNAVSEVSVWEVRTFFHDGSGFVSHRFHHSPAQPWPCEQTAQEVAQAWRCLWPDELEGLPLRVAVRPAGEACAPVVVELPEVAAPLACASMDWGRRETPGAALSETGALDARETAHPASHETAPPGPPKPAPVLEL